MNATPIDQLTPEMLDVIEASSIWKPASVDQEPECRLYDWRVMKVGGSYIHFVGYNGYEGRVCSAVQTYDPTTKRGITRSGRVYELVGQSGHNRDAQYVWARWLELNGLTKEDAQDVSSEYE